MGITKYKVIITFDTGYQETLTCSQFSIDRDQVTGKLSRVTCEVVGVKKSLYLDITRIISITWEG